MEANHTSRVPGRDGVVDHATLYLCRQGETWVVVIESDRFSGALRLRDASQDAYDARFELLSKARRACPDAAIASSASVEIIGAYAVKNNHGGKCAARLSGFSACGR